MKLNQSGLSDANTKKVMNELEDCNIKFSDNSFTAVANIMFEKKKEKYEVYYSVQNAAGKIIVPDRRMLFKDTKGVGKELALRLFGVGGPREFELDK